MGNYWTEGVLTTARTAAPSTIFGTAIKQSGDSSTSSTIYTNVSTGTASLANVKLSIPSTSTVIISFGGYSSIGGPKIGNTSSPSFRLFRDSTTSTTQLTSTSVNFAKFSSLAITYTDSVSSGTYVYDCVGAGPGTAITLGDTQIFAGFISAEAAY